MASYIGTPTSRVDGHAKVTGAAKYAGEFNVSGLAYGAVVASTIAKGRIARIDTSEALRVPGVLDVLTHENRPRMAATSAAYKDDVAPEKGSPFRPLYDDKILFSGQPIALVLAEEWEIARFAASLVRVEYKKQPHSTDLFARRDRAFVAETPERPRGKADRAYAAAAVRHEAEYYIPIEHHNPMELYASTVMWDGDGKLTVYDKTQGVQNVQHYLCGVFKMKPDDVRVVSPFVGGAFGSGLRPQYQVVLAVLAARALERSVRLVLTRQQMYGLGYRPATIERLAIGATADGTLNAISHEAIAVTSQYEDFCRNDTGWSAHSAIFAEVKVDEAIGVIRVTRVVDAVAAGRILNTKTAHSQIMGSVVWGIGMALHEETLLDHEFGRIMNANIAEYHVPVNSDVHDIEVIFVDEPDAIINPLGIKGVGEIGIVGVAAAIANAIYHATGKRVRDLPITIDKLQRS